MSFILYAAGLLIGVALFLYFLSLYTSGKEKLSSLGGEKKGTENGGEEKKQGTPRGGEEGMEEIRPEYIRFRGLADLPPGERICPLCRATLTRFEPLYASQVKTDSGQKILIHGCPKCYKGAS